MADKEKNFVSAVVYVHNAGERLDRFLAMVTSVLEANFEHAEIICVNDASTDNSVDVIREFSKSVTLSSISILNENPNPPAMLGRME